MTEERESYQLRGNLPKYPAAVRAMLDASKQLRCPVDTLSFQDVERGQSTIPIPEQTIRRPTKYLSGGLEAVV